MAWSVNGTYFEACNCAAACPCVFLSAPTEGNCTVVVAWHIDKGSFEGASLDGFNVALLAHSPGHMLQTKWKVALYLDSRASVDQQKALGQIFSGQAGGRFDLQAPERERPRHLARSQRQEWLLLCVRLPGLALAFHLVC